MEIRLRKALPKDALGILAIEEQCFKTDKITLKQFHYLLTKSKSLVLVATVNKQVVAYSIVLLRAHIAAARLYSIAVLPEFQKHGIGKKLIKKSMAALKQQSYKNFSLEVRASHQHTVTFYKALGFCQVKTLPAYYQDGAMAFRMKLKLL